MRILEDGRYDDVSIEDYHREIKGYSKSSLDKINKSYSHYLHSEDKETDAMLFGRAYHTAVLEPEKYKSEYVVGLDMPKRSKADKEQHKLFEEIHEGKTIISKAQNDVIEAMKNKMFEHPKVSALLTHGDAEHTFIWTDPKTGLKCKARPDYYRRNGIVIDLKTTQDASWFDFQRSIAKFRYHVQGAFFMDGIHESTGEMPKYFVLIAQEKTYPYEIAIYSLDTNAIDIGRVAYETNLATAKEYEDNPDMHCGYPVDIQEMYLPAWCN